VDRTIGLTVDTLSFLAGQLWRPGKVEQ
jgi:hypothetical protein